MKKIIYTIILMLIALPVYASNKIEEELTSNGTYLNNNNLTITPEIYENVKETLTIEEIENMREGLYNSIKQYGKIQNRVKKYIKTKDYEDIAGNVLSLSEEITEEEYESDISYNSRGSTEYETTSKIIELYVFNAINSNVPLTLQLEWKKEPVNKSFDVLGIRVNANTTFGNLEGIQQGLVDSTWQTVNYASDSQNFKVLSNGFGLSQNLLNAATDYYQTMSGTLKCNNASINIYATYQHVRGNITLAQSQGYTFSSSGLGNVLKYFDTTIANMYDGMQGISIVAAC